MDNTMSPLPPYPRSKTDPMARLCFWRAYPNALATFVEFAASIGRPLMNDILMPSMLPREGSTRPPAHGLVFAPSNNRCTTNNGRPFGVGARGGDSSAVTCSSHDHQPSGA
jgi:hypothetical protein